MHKLNDLSIYQREKYEEFHQKTSIQSKIVSKKNFTYRILINKIDKYVPPHSSVLDIGCGAGTLALYYASKKCKVLGIDISSKAISEAKQSAESLGYKNCSFEKVNFPQESPSGSFDRVICTEVIEHLADDNLAFKRIHNLLKKDGIAIISTPSKSAPLHKLGLTRKFDEKVGHLRRYDISQLKALAKDANLEVVETGEEEGIIRNFLFINPLAGKVVRFLKFFIADFVSFLDLLSLKIFGASQLFIVIRKK